MGISSISHCISVLFRTRFHFATAWVTALRGKPRQRKTPLVRLKRTLWKEDRARTSSLPSPPPRSNRWSSPLSPAGSSSDRLDSIRHLFYFFLFLFFNLAARERSGLLIDVALSKLETCGLGGEGPKPLSWVPLNHFPQSLCSPNQCVGVWLHMCMSGELHAWSCVFVLMCVWL